MKPIFVIGILIYIFGYLNYIICYGFWLDTENTPCLREWFFGLFWFIILPVKFINNKIFNYKYLRIKK